MRRLLTPGLIIAAMLFCTSATWAASGPEASDEPVHVVADSLEVDNKARIAHFFGDVKANQGDVKLDCDQLDVHYTGDDQAEGESEVEAGLTESGGDVKKIVAIGHVKITQKDRVALGRKATYWAGARKILLEGQATVWKGENQVSGEKITVFLDEDRSVVHGKPGKRVSVTIKPGKKKK